MSEQDILARIKDLVAAEHDLRSQTAAGKLDPETEHKQLAQLETLLDQCWDLLRQRRARIDAGQSPDDATVQSVVQVEGYLQ
ncbi:MULTISPECIES: DUF2630 family protein [Antrihabitans]|jgi:hypothetical protein|uniref:DUF2630 family protein n=2 Tax=Antrihabitans TaxID=2799491 RepID=A0A934NST5_9NOCA|nr:DUF2630 family protein [Antrihabitans stalagmiti]MBJ8340582.1 DUF2630 family protein [Antrihabitans stalagmiti]